MRINGKSGYSSGRGFALVAICAISLLAVGCGGGSDDPAPSPVPTDPAAPAPVPGANPAAPSVPPVAGDPAIGATPLPILGGVSVTTVLNCQVDSATAPSVLEPREIVVDRGTASFLVEDVPFIVGPEQWSWLGSREWSATQESTLPDGRLDEREAKFDINNTATYFRNKLSNPNGSRISEIECFNGVTIRPRTP